MYIFVRVAHIFSCIHCGAAKFTQVSQTLPPSQPQASSLEEFPPWHSMLLHQGAPHVDSCGTVQMWFTDVPECQEFLRTILAASFLSRFLCLCHPNTGTAAPKSRSAGGHPSSGGSDPGPSPALLRQSSWQNLGRFWWQQQGSSRYQLALHGKMVLLHRDRLRRKGGWYASFSLC